MPRPPSRTNSASVLRATPPSRTSPTEALTALRDLDAHYAIWWECAELLIDLSGGGPAGTATVAGQAVSGSSSYMQSQSALPLVMEDTVDRDGKKGDATPRRRERAITLEGGEVPPLPGLAGAGMSSSFLHQALILIRVLQYRFCLGGNFATRMEGIDWAA